MIHISIVHRRFIQPILHGLKTIEVCSGNAKSSPFMRINPGDRIYFKAAGGSFLATALVERAWFLSNLNPSGIAQLRNAYNDRIRGDAAFWKRVARARYLSMIGLHHAEAVWFGPDFAAHEYTPRCTWYTLPDRRDVYPLCMLPEAGTLTATG